MLPKVRALGSVLAPIAALLIAPGRPATARPDTIELAGVVRDFSQSHSDFGVDPWTTPYHAAGLVRFELGDRDHPELAAGDGYKIEEQWTNGTREPIAPHLYQTPTLTVSGPAFYVNGPISVSQGEVDSYDPLLGTPGLSAVLVTNTTDSGGVQITRGANIFGQVIVGAGGNPSSVVHVDGNSGVSGGVGVLAEPFIPPTVTVPELEDEAGDLSLGGGTIDGDLEVDSLTILKNKTVTIDGEVTIVCEGDFVMRNRAGIVLLEGATLQLYVLGDVDLGNNTTINEDSADSSRVTIYSPSDGAIELSNHHRLYGNVIAPAAHLKVSNNATLGGSFYAGRLTMQNGFDLEMTDGATVVSTHTGCLDLDDRIGARGVIAAGEVASESSFETWFCDDLSANLSQRHAIELTRNAHGVYEYLDDEFYPIDGELMGNGDGNHNHDFTYAITAQFTYEPCEGQFVEVMGGDGAWVFIDRNLVIDLGGVQTGVSQLVELDRLELARDQVYQVHVFWANRSAAGSNFQLRTNLPLGQSPLLATVTDPYD